MINKFKNEDKLKKETVGIFGLIIVTLFWGFGFPALKIVGEYFPTFYMIGFRFGIAALTLSTLFYKKLKLINKKLIKNGLVLSFFLFLTYIFATVGIMYTTSSRASFFTCIHVLLIPFILRIFLKEKVAKKTIISVVICTVGLFLLSYTKEMGLTFASGDLICVLGALCYAVHVVITGILAKDNDPALLTIIQLTFVAMFGFIIAVFTETIPSAPSGLSIVTLILLGVFCSALAFYLQTACQRFISSDRVGVIFSLEPVFGVMASYIILGENLGSAGVLGGICVFIALAYQESDFKLKSNKSSSKGDTLEN